MSYLNSAEKSMKEVFIPNYLPILVEQLKKLETENLILSSWVKEKGPRKFILGTDHNELMISGNICKVSNTHFLVGVGHYSGSLQSSSHTPYLIKLINIINGRCDMNFNGHSTNITAICMASKTTFLTVSKDNIIKLWNIKKDNCLNTFYVCVKHKFRISNMIKVTDTTFLLASDINNTEDRLKLFDITADSFVKNYYGHTEGISFLSRVSTNKFLSSSYDNNIKLWMVDNETCIKTFIGHQEEVISLSPVNDKTFLSASLDNTVKLWNINEDKCLKTFYIFNNSKFSRKIPIVCSVSSKKFIE